jgi:drug/metabolite transporter (DMT)-like permease
MANGQSIIIIAVVSSTLSKQDPQLLRQRRVWADLALLTVSLIWGAAFVVQRIAAAQIGVFLFTGMRFLLGAAALTPLAIFGAGRAGRRSRAQRQGITRETLAGIALLGLLMVGGAAFQQAGLIYTTAGNAGFITGLYVVLIPLFLALFWKQRPHLAIWVAALMSAIGLFLLSTGGQMRLNRGDILVLICALFWAVHVILLGRLVHKVDVLQLSIGQYLVCGSIGLVIGLVLEADTLPAMVENWWVVAYTGLLSVGLGYTLQAVGQRVAPPADAAIILSLEAVFAALSGWLFLGETLGLMQLLGCGIMFAGMSLAQSDSLLGRVGAER